VSNPAEFDRLKVVLVNARNPLNIGAAARAMSNFGFLQMRVVNPYDAGFREARSAVGASSVLADAEQRATVGDAVADCELVVGTTAVGDRELHHRVKALPDAVKLVRKRLAVGDNVALLFGSERVGLSNEEMSHCHWLLRIPTRVEHRSMNLGQAVAICVYEMARAMGKPIRVHENRAHPAAQQKPANAADIERLSRTLLEALHACGYLTAKSGKLPENKIRRLLRRHGLTVRDADLWQSMLGQILWSLRAKETSAKS
jgi:TrmH family RNA methyltransferase